MIGKILRKSIFVLICTLTLHSLKGQVVINEFSCSNLSQFIDNHNDYNDWIELYNTGSSTINLAGYYLSDDSVTVFKWQIPSGITISPFGFLRFWASGRNEVS